METEERKKTGSQFRMEGGEENCGSVNLKRQREPLLDSEDNVFSASGVSDAEKRRRLEVFGQESCSAVPSSSDGRLVEPEMKPDTPIVPSVQSQIQLLPQIGDGVSDAEKRRRLEVFGQESCSAVPSSSDGRLVEPEMKPDTPIVPSVQSQIQLLPQIGDAQGEFNQRRQRFQAPTSETMPSSTSSCPQTRSNFVSNIQQKLQSTLTTSSKQAMQMRQEREMQLRMLSFPSISENVWLKNSSDSSIQQGGTSSGSSLPSSWCPRSQSKVWPPMQPGDQVGCDAETKGSFTEALATAAEKPPAEMTELERSHKAPCGEEVREQQESGEGCSEDMHAGDNVLTLSVTNGSQSLTEIQASDPQEIQQHSDNGRLEAGDNLTVGKVSKKVSFILEPELINSSAFTESETSMESRAETSLSDCGLSSHDETNTAEIIDQMFEEVLEYGGKVEKERLLSEDGTDCDSGIVSCSGGKEVEKEKHEETVEEECDQGKKLESREDELTFPAAGILSPLSKSVDAVVTLLRLAATEESNLSSLLLTPNETSTPPAESAPLYSIDAYRSQRQHKPPTIQSVTPGVQRRAPDTSKPQTSANTKEEIAALNEEAAKLQTVINQTLQALSCCTDEEHGRGSLEEAEAEKLLLVSCEKHSALLAEVARLRQERSSESDEADYISQQPCRGTVSISSIQLPLKVEFVCSSHNRTGRPSHYFFVLIRYGPHNIVATPLATGADALNGDAISFPTFVTLNDICASFEIDVEVYSLTHTPGTACSTDQATTRSWVTPRKLLNTITRSSSSHASSGPSTNRSSDFCLVGSHKITLASLGQSKFPLDKMKFEGKIRRLLGDEFQEKVPFLSPLEGNIYLQLDSQSHSVTQYQGFLTMFDLISGFGSWHRRYFVLEGCNMHYWNNPNDRETKEAEGSINLSRSPSQCVRPVERDSCARPFTFELVSNVAQDQNQEAFSKCWFSADTKQERLDWIECLNQALLDFHAWNRTQSSSQQTKTPSCGNPRESML